MELIGLPPEPHSHIYTIHQPQSTTPRPASLPERKPIDQKFIQRCSTLASKYTKLENEHAKRVKLFAFALLVTAVAIVIIGVANVSAPALIAIGILGLVGVLIVRQIMKNLDLQKKYHGYVVGFDTPNFKESFSGLILERLEEKDILLLAEMAYLNVRYNEVAKKIKELRQTMLDKKVGLTNFNKYVKADPKDKSSTIVELPTQAATQQSYDVDLLKYLDCSAISRDFPLLRVYCDMLSDCQVEAYDIRSKMKEYFPKIHELIVQHKSYQILHERIKAFADDSY